MRLGIFGGSFDPIHYGHLLLAELCLERCRLDEVWFLPAATPPHKQDQTLCSGKQRVEMLELAIGGREEFRINTYEIDRGGVNYTADTLEAIAAQQPNAELFFLLGGDSLRDLPTWRDPERICAAAIPVVMNRHGAPKPDYDVLTPFVEEARLAEIREYETDTPIIELSSTELRRRAANDQSLWYRTPRAVQMYIFTNKLYR